MNVSKTKLSAICFVAMSLVILMVLFQGVGYAEMKPVTPSNQLQIRDKEPAHTIPAIKRFPDLKVSLTVIKSSTGLVTLQGIISNVGTADYNIPTEAEIFMNLSYPPKTYNQIGVSEKLCSKPFSTLNKGASFPFNCTYQIPDFNGWTAAAVPPNAKRLFTLRVAKKDMSPFKTDEDSNTNNNSKGVEVSYIEKR